MKRYEIPKEQMHWDRYSEFHIVRGPITYFATGELVVTDNRPHVNFRYHYDDFNVELATTADRLPQLYTQDGQEVPNAWLDDNGQQYLLIDHDLHVVVRTDGTRRCWRTLISSNHDKTKPVDLLPGVPARFQPIAFAYIGGPQCFPVGCTPIVARAPLNKAGYSTEEREHIEMIVNTARAAMKLTGHPSAVEGQYAKGFYSGVDPDLLLRCKTWQDVPEAKLRELYLYGAGRRKLLFDYLLTEKP